ncbi:PAS domain-containing sensor histidine kinase [Sediminicola sp. 1XM1-17]|uniref:PAS domain-containing sensor histidine kinase n=1 Tax=Sediminicola sp. 1XM1-17 TaxID=3127702 RepID=UPI00307814DF
MKSNNTEHYFLKGGGEMGKLIRNKDWGNTPLGDPKDWPHSLQTMVSVMLDNPFGMYIAWGKEYTQIYNDGYRPILGQTKHPNALGISTRKTFSEIWHIIGSMFDGVMEGIPVGFPDFMLPLDRNGFVENCYFDFAYSPIRLDNGEVGGVLVTVIETTNKKKAEVELKESENELHFAVEAAQLGTFDFNPLTNNFSANNRLKKWFGLPPEEQIELSHATDAIVESDKERVSNAIEKALDYSLGGNYDIEYTIINPISKKEIILNAKGRAWFNENKIAYRLNGTVEDVTEEVIARQKVEEKERSILTLVESAPFPIAVYTGTELRITLANQSIMDVWGKGNDVIGKLYTDILPELEGQQIFEQVREVLATGIPFHAKNQKVNLTIQGKLKSHYFNYSFTPLFDASGTVYGVMNTAAEVTELNEAKQKVEAALEEIKLFKFMADTAGDPFILMDEDGHFVYLNEMALQKWGYTEQEIKQLKVPDVDVIYDDEKFHELFKQSQVKSIPPFETLHKNKEGLIYPVEISMGSVRKDGTLLMFAIARDITERKKAEEDIISAFRKIEENEERLNIIINASELGVWEYHVKTDKINTSKRCQEIFGVFENEHAAHLDTSAFFHPDDLIVRKNAIEKSFKTGVLQYQGRIIWSDHSIHWVESRGKVFFDKHNGPERVIGTMRDITEEKNFHNQLLEREQKFRLLADSMAQHIWTSEPNGNLNYFNKSIFEYSGLSSDELMGDGWLQIVHPDDQDMFRKEWLSSIKTGKDFLLEHRYRKSDGQYRWHISRALPQQDKNGEITMWVGTSTDIQEQKMFTNELEKQVYERTKELNQKNIDLEKMNKELQAFAYISSHDLQEPLRKIQIFATQIVERESQNLTENGKDKFHRMQKAANRMQHLIQDLLAYSRTNPEDRSYEIINLKQVIELVKEDLKEELQQNNATIELDEICEVKIIPFQFRQLIFNLLSNTLKFKHPKKSPIITIQCKLGKGSEFNLEKLSEEMEYCHIQIKDNGIGFEQEYSEKIFEVFQRLHGKDQYNGTGIGLAIVKKIVENHNGYITAKGELNEGATFNIYIPSY